MADKVLPVPVFGQKYGFILVQEGTRESLLASAVTDGDTSHAPTGDAVFDALDTKVAKAGDTMTGSLQHYIGAVSSQQVERRIGWSNNVQRWAEVLETDGSYSLWSYDTAGATPTIALNIKTTVAGGSNNIFFRGNTMWHTGNLADPGKLSATQTWTGANTFPGVTVNSATDGGSNQGIRHWLNSDTNWATYIAQSGAGKSFGGGTAPAALSGQTGYHLRVRVSTNSGGVSASQGVIWENGSDQALMSLSADTGDLWAKGRVRSLGAHFNSTTNAVVLGCAAGGTVHLRPNGSDNAGNSIQILSTGFTGIGGVTPVHMLDVNGRVRLLYNGTYGTPGIWMQTTAGADKWFFGVRDNTSAGIYNQTVPGFTFLVDDFGRTMLKNANSTTMTTQPRVFVQASDPGAAAADGDLWFW